MKGIKKFAAVILVLFILVSTSFVANADDIGIDEREFMITMLDNIGVEYYSEDSKEELANIFIENDISNLEKIDEYMGSQGYPNLVYDLKTVFENKDLTYDMIPQEQIEWAMYRLIMDDVEEFTPSNHLLQYASIKTMFTYYYENFYQPLYGMIDYHCADKEQIDYLFVKIFTFYLNYCFVYLTDHQALFDLITTSDTVPQQAPVNVLDLDEWQESWKYKSATVSKKLTRQNRALTDQSDVINVSSANLDNLDMQYTRQLVDNGAVLVVQNETGISTCNEMATVLDLPEQEVVANADEQNTINLGYSVRSTGTGYEVAPIFASVMKQKDSTEAFDLSQELINLENSGDAYIDPVSFYYSAEDSRNNTPKKDAPQLPQTGVLQINREQAYKKASGYQYLYGKNGDAVWGDKAGYTPFAYVELHAYIIRQYSKNGYKYDAVECSFTATGMNDKYVEYYEVATGVISGTYIDNYLDINIEAESTYTFTYTSTPDGPEIGHSVSTTINPGSQCIKTAKTHDKTVWKCTPYSNSHNNSWKIETSCVTETSSYGTATMGFGFDVITVNNWQLQYTNPIPVGMNISYS